MYGLSTYIWISGLSGAGELGQLVQPLLNKHTKQSLGPKNPCKCEVSLVAHLQFHQRESGSGGIPGVNWLTRLARTSSSGFKKEFLLYPIVTEKDSTIGLRPAQTHMNPHTCKHTCTPTPHRGTYNKKIYDSFSDSFCTWYEVGVGVFLRSYGWFSWGYSTGKRLDSLLLQCIFQKQLALCIQIICGASILLHSRCSPYSIVFIYMGDSRTDPACLHLWCYSESKDQEIEALQSSFVGVALVPLSKSVTKLPFSWYFYQDCIWSLSVLLTIVLY